MKAAVLVLLGVLALTGCEGPPALTQIECNPTFHRGDIVQFRGMSGVKYVVRYMYHNNCSALINDERLNENTIGTDLLEKVSQ